MGLEYSGTGGMGGGGSGGHAGGREDIGQDGEEGGGVQNITGRVGWYVSGGRDGAGETYRTGGLVYFG